MRCATFVHASARSKALADAQAAAALEAAATASSTSFAHPWATSAITSPLEGLVAGAKLPVAGSRQLPPTRSPWRMTWVVGIAQVPRTGTLSLVNGPLSQDFTSAWCVLTNKAAAAVCDMCFTAMS